MCQECASTGDATLAEFPGLVEIKTTSGRKTGDTSSGKVHGPAPDDFLQEVDSQGVLKCKGE